MYGVSHSATGRSSGEPIFVDRPGSVIHHRPFMGLKVLPSANSAKFFRRLGQSAVTSRLPSGSTRPACPVRIIVSQDAKALKGRKIALVVLPQIETAIPARTLFEPRPPATNSLFGDAQGGRPMPPASYPL